MTLALPALIQREGAGRETAWAHHSFPAIPRGRASSRNKVHNTRGNAAHVFKLVTFLPVTHLDAGSSKISPDPASFLITEHVHNTHSESPVLRLASENMEENVSCVCPFEVGEREVEEAREIHERLLFRLMISPGDNRKSAMYRAEAMFGLSYWCQHNLKHKHRASAEFVLRLHAAWRMVLEQSVKRDVAELLRTEAAE